MLTKILIILLFPFVLVAQSKPNIIFIYADDMGNGEFAFTNGAGVTGFETPILDSIRNEAMYFRNFYVPTICTPSRASLMSGKYAHRYGLQNWVQYHYDDRGLPDTVRTLPEYLKEAGYMTGIIGKWHLGISRVGRLPQSQGFDYSFVSLQGNPDYYTKINQGGIIDLVENGIRVIDTTYHTELITDKALQYIENQAADTTCPFFLYLPYTTPHTNYATNLQAPQSYIDMAPSGWTTRRKTQWAMDKIFDESVGRIWGKVRELGIDSNTIIIITADNGGSNQYGVADGDNTPFRSYKLYLYEGGVHMPLLWYQPGVVQNNSTYDSLAHIIDILPTLIQGVIGRNTDFTDGINLYEYMKGLETPPADRYIIYHLDDYREWGIRKGNYVLLNNPNQQVTSSTSLSTSKSLYNIATDVAQTTNIIGSNPTKANELEAIILSRMSEVKPATFTGNLTFTPFSPLPAYWGQASFYYNPSYLYFNQNQPK